MDEVIKRNKYHYEQDKEKLIDHLKACSLLLSIMSIEHKIINERLDMNGDCSESLYKEQIDALLEAVQKLEI